MIYVLFDNPAKIAFVTDAITEPYEVMNIGGEKGPFLKKIYSCCRKCSKKAQPGDTIICWLDLMGILCYYLTGKKNVRIIAINILLKEKASLKNLLYRKLYKGALKSDRVIATVTSTEYGKYLNELLNIDRRYVLLHDAYNGAKLGKKEDSPIIPVDKKSVFCGGKNGRDWDLAINTARKLPDVTFNFVMPKSVFKRYESLFSNGSLSNVKYYVDVSKTKFTEVLDSSAFVAMPLDSQAPSGLLVFYQATARGKMIMTSDTVTTREYFSDGRGVLCGDSADSWAEKITYCLEHPKETAQINESCRKFLEDKCSIAEFQRILQLTL